MLSEKIIGVWELQSWEGQTLKAFGDMYILGNAQWKSMPHYHQALAHGGSCDRQEKCTRDRPGSYTD